MSTDNTNSLKLPNDLTMQHACKLAITEDKPIMMDYWKFSIDKVAFIGQKSSTKEKYLIKNEEEYTSNIAKIFRVSNEFIVMTENSIYIVDSSIPMRKIESA